MKVIVLLVVKIWALMARNDGIGLILSIIAALYLYIK